jgi:hypothetical protein
MRLSLIGKVCLMAICATQDPDVAVVAIGAITVMVWLARKRSK